MDWDKAKEIYIKQGGANCEECPAYHTCTLWEPIAECCIATIADEEEEQNDKRRHDKTDG